MQRKIPGNFKDIQIRGVALPYTREAKNQIEDVMECCNVKLAAVSFLRNMICEKTFASIA